MNGTEGKGREKKDDDAGKDCSTLPEGLYLFQYIVNTRVRLSGVWPRLAGVFWGSRVHG